MTAERIGKGRRIAAVSCVAGLMAGCSSAPETGKSGEPSSRPSMVVLAIDTGPREVTGPIQGLLRCEDKGPPLPPCLADDVALAEAVLACGPVEATIDRGSSHRLFVHFPAHLSEPSPGMPADLDIVRCVQGRVGFSFSAGVATDPSGILEGDPAPFEALHSKRP
jgi:hypothetical protein